MIFPGYATIPTVTYNLGHACMSLWLPVVRLIVALPSCVIDHLYTFDVVMRSQTQASGTWHNYNSGSRVLASPKASSYIIGLVGIYLTVWELAHIRA